jgi:hypothetical protein
MLAPGAQAQPLLLPDSPLGAHAMLYYDTPLAADNDLFQQAADEHAGTVRLDVFLPQITNGAKKPDWSWVTRIRRLALRWRTRVLINVTGTPPDWTACPKRKHIAWLDARCPPRDPSRWAQLVGEVAGKLHGTAATFEVWNEPDGAWTFVGTAAQYGVMLGDAARAIGMADPGAGVTNGGIMNPAARGGTKWLKTALSAAGSDIWHNLSALNVHLRGREDQLAPQLRAWERFAATAGRANIPVWVSETGYPADPRYQSDPAYQGGEQAQANWLTAALRDLYAAGADKIFVTQRDMAPNMKAYASEGLLAGLADPMPSKPVVRRRPAWFAARDFASQHLSSQSPLQVLGVTIPTL